MKTYVLRLTPEGRPRRRPWSRPSRRRTSSPRASRSRSAPGSGRWGRRRPGRRVFLDGVKKGKKRVDLPANGEAEVTFPPFKLDADVDDAPGIRPRSAARPTRSSSTTCATSPSRSSRRRKVLVVSDLAADAEFVADALDPDPPTLPPGTPRPFHVERVLTSKFAREAPRTSEALRLHLPEQRQRRELERRGMGQAERLRPRRRGAGRRARPAHRRPSTIGADRRADPAGGPRRPRRRSRSRRRSARWPTSPTRSSASTARSSARSSRRCRSSKYWSVKPHDAGSRVLLSTRTTPALLERVFKGSRTGRVLLWTTPLSRRADPSRPTPGTSSHPLAGWSFFYLMNQTVPYLSGTSEEGLDFEAGRDVVLPIDPTRRFKDYIVSDPKGKATETLSPPVASDALVIVSPQPIGKWSVKGTGTEAGAEASASASTRRVSETQFVAARRRPTWTALQARRSTPSPTTPKGLDTGIQIRPDRARAVPLDHGPDPGRRDGREPAGEPVLPRVGPATGLGLIAARPRRTVEDEGPRGARDERQLHPDRQLVVVAVRRRR